MASFVGAVVAGAACAYAAPEVVTAAHTRAYGTSAAPGDSAELGTGVATSSVDSPADHPPVATASVDPVGSSLAALVDYDGHGRRLIESTSTTAAVGDSFSSGCGVAAETDPLIEFANANRGSGTRFASEYTSPSGAKYYDVNAARDALPEGHPLSATGHHGGCAEFGCLLQAYEAEGPAAIQGGQMRTVYVRGPESPIPPGPPTGHGAPAAPCGKACQPLLDHLGVDW